MGGGRNEGARHEGGEEGGGRAEEGGATEKKQLQAGGAPLPPPAATTLEADEEHNARHASQTCDRCQRIYRDMEARRHNAAATLRYNQPLFEHGYG